MLFKKVVMETDILLKSIKIYKNEYTKKSRMCQNVNIYT